MVVEVIYNGDCSYEDVQECDRCDGSGLRCSCPPGPRPVTWENRAYNCLVHGDGEEVEYVRADDIEGGLPF